ncbi:MAG: ABC transporter ATP-binding protein [Sulfolobales archaeon]
MSVILRTASVSKYFGGLKAVDRVSIEIKEGGIVGLIGPNGSGKTTLFNVITGVYKPDEGEVWFRDKRIDGLRPDQIYKLGVVRTFQIPRPFTGMSVYENILTAARDHPGDHPIRSLLSRKWYQEEIKLAQKAVEVLRFLRLLDSASSKPYELFGGGLKLLEIARGLVSEPKILLLDEPVAGVEPDFAHEVFRYVKRLREEYGLTFFIIEHKIDILFNYIDYVYVMDRGRVIYHGDPEGATKDPRVIEAYIGV